MEKELVLLNSAGIEAEKSLEEKRYSLKEIKESPLTILPEHLIHTIIKEYLIWQANDLETLTTRQTLFANTPQASAEDILNKEFTLWSIDRIARYHNKAVVDSQILTESAREEILRPQHLLSRLIDAWKGRRLPEEILKGLERALQLQKDAEIKRSHIVEYSANLETENKMREEESIEQACNMIKAAKKEADEILQKARNDAGKIYMDCYKEAEARIDLLRKETKKEVAELHSEARRIEIKIEREREKLMTIQTQLVNAAKEHGAPFPPVSDEREQVQQLILGIAKEFARSNLWETKYDGFGRDQNEQMAKELELCLWFNERFDTIYEFFIKIVVQLQEFQSSFGETPTRNLCFQIGDIFNASVSVLKASVDIHHDWRLYSDPKTFYTFLTSVATGDMTLEDCKNIKFEACKKPCCHTH